MAGIVWWTEKRLAFVRERAAAGESAREIAKAVTRKYRRRVKPGTIGDLCWRKGIPLLAKGGAPIGNLNAVGGKQRRKSS